MATTNIDRVKELGLQEPELVKLKAADGKTDVYGILFKPADFDPNKKYPLYVQVYGGPSPRNSNSYQAAGPKARLAQLGYIVWELDGRGTTRRGKKHLTETYLKFGQVEVDALQKEGKNFDMMYYPEHRHVIGGYNAQYFAKLTMEYFLRHLKPEAWEESLKAIWRRKIRHMLPDF